MRPEKPRIAPLNLDEITDEQYAIGGGRDNPFCHLNLFRTLVQHPDLLQSFIPFSMQLGQRSLLDRREQEILILRTAALCNDSYEAAHHDIIARRAGMSDEEIEAAREEGENFSPFEQVLMKAVEELIKDHCISDETWAALAERYTQQQMIEVAFVVANYTLMAMVTNSLGIQLEKDVESAWKPTD